MKKDYLFRIGLLLMCMLFSMSVKGQSWPSITGVGASGGTLAEVGKECKYTISYSIGTLSADKKKLVSWEVGGGVIKSQNGNDPSVTIVWNSGISRGTITAKNVYDDAQKNFISINTPVTIYDATGSGVALGVTTNAMTYLVNEVFDIVVTINPDYYGLRVSGDGFVVKSGGGTKNIKGYFNTVGEKILQVEAINNKNEVIKVAQKTIKIISDRITGANMIQGAASYTLGNLPANFNIKWSVSSNLQILSGQNTSTITVQPTSSSINAEGIINATIENKNIQMKIWIGLPDPMYILPAVGYRGDNTIYRKDESSTPSFEYNFNRAFVNWISAGEILEYQWSANGWNVVENTYITNPTNPIMHEVAFLAKNPVGEQAHLSMRARNIFGWGPWSDYITINIKSGTGLYSVFANSQSNTIEIVPKKTSGNLKVKAFLNYELYNVSTGQFVKNGVLNIDGGFIDVSNVVKGIYILNLNSPVKEVHKVFIK